MEEPFYTRLSQIRAFIFDIDGVLTNGQLLLLDNGEWLRSMSIKDGFAIKHAIELRYPLGIISGSGSDAVALRLKALGVTDVYLNETSKKAAFERFILSHELETREVLYMGDDIPDLIPMQMAGLACCPQDAAAEIKHISHFVSHKNGGQGCVREVIEMVLKLYGHWEFNGPS